MSNKREVSNNENLLCVHACICVYTCMYEHTSNVKLRRTMKQTALLHCNYRECISSMLMQYINIPLQTGQDRPSFAGCSPALVSDAKVLDLTTSDSRVMLSVISFIWSSACWTVLLSSTLQLKGTEKTWVNSINYLTKEWNLFLHIGICFISCCNTYHYPNSWKSSSIKAKLFREFCFQ